jgi:predicted site-specific integrase-resolvase
MIRTERDLQNDVNELKDREEKMCRERTILTQSINTHRKQIVKLEEMILDNNQYELYSEE